jgi:integrase
MAIEKVGIYRKWLGAVPKDSDGKPIPESQWPRKRRYHWIVRWYSTDGKRYGKVFEIRKEAEDFALKIQEQVNLGRSDRPQRITLHNFIDEHEKVMAGQVACGTIQDQMRALKLFEKFIGGLIVLNKIQPRHAEAFIANRLASDLSVATVNKDIRTLKRVFNLAIEPRRYLAQGQNPFANIKQRKKAASPIRYVEVAEYHKLMDAAKNIWWKAVISLAYGSGLRRNEILNLTWSDIDFEKQMILVRAKQESIETIEWEPKDHENRAVPMSNESDQLLADIQTNAPEKHPYVFVSPQRFVIIKERQDSGKWNSRCNIVNNVTKNFTNIRSKAGAKELTLHDLRRSAITNWAQSLPIQVVQQLAGHSDITTTRQYYLSVRPEDLASASDLINALVTKTKAD